MGKTINKSRKYHPSWWNEACQKAIEEKNHAFNRLQKQKTLENKIQFKKMRATARRAYLENSRKSWIEYLSSLNNQAPTTTIWKKV